jgi:hypothetical protein
MRRRWLGVVRRGFGAQRKSLHGHFASARVKGSDDTTGKHVLYLYDFWCSSRSLHSLSSRHFLLGKGWRQCCKEESQGGRRRFYILPPDMSGSFNLSMSYT